MSKGAHGGLLSCLNKLYESADKPDPRDELIRVYEEALEFVDMYGRINHTRPKDYHEITQEALAQGAEIKKRMEEG